MVKTDSFELAMITKGDENSTKLAILIPGRLDTKDYAHNISHIDYLSTKGYYALSFDPPGTWDSPGGIELYTTTNNIKAVDELIEHLGNKPTLLMGHSRGGTIAMLAGIKNPFVTHFVSVFSNYAAPVPPDPERIVNGKLIELRDLPPGASRTEEKKRFELPMSYFEDGAKYNALDGLSTCTKPKLFFYGERDTENDPKNIKKAFEVAAEPKVMHGIDSEHDYRLHSDKIDEVNSFLGEFLDSTK